MKKIYNTPKLSVYGSVDTLTQQIKSLGTDDGVILVIPGITPGDGVSVGPTMAS